MSRTAILHIGDEKAGSKSIQSFLRENTQALAAQNAYMSQAAQMGPYHSGLTASVMEIGAKRTVEQLEWAVTSEQDAVNLRARLSDEIAAEAAQAGQDGSVVFTHEGLSHLQAPEISRLQALLAPHFDEIRIIMYLRRQDRQQRSAYNQRIRAGDAPVNVLPWVDDLIGGEAVLRQYDQILGAWAQFFGEAAITPRIFHKHDLHAGDLVADFITTAALGAPEDYEPTPRANESMDYAAQELVKRINPLAPYEVDGAVDPARRAFVHRLTQTRPGVGRLPAREEAMAYMQAHAPSNEIVRARWFPERTTLFDEDYSDYPENESPSPEEADIALIAFDVWKNMQNELDHLKGELAVMRAREALSNNKAALAQMHAKRAAEFSPESAAGQLMLARASEQVGDFAQALEAAQKAALLAPDNTFAPRIIERLLREVERT